MSPPATGALRLVENQGQFETAARFVGELPGAIVRVEPDALVIDRREGDGGALVRLEFVGASADVGIEGIEKAEGIHSYFRGNEPLRWVQGAPAYRSVRYHGLYPGIDLIVRSERSELEYDLRVQPGADPSEVAIRCVGADGVGLDPDGSLRIETPKGPLVHRSRRSWQTSPQGEQREVQVLHRLVGERTFGFAVEGWDPSTALVIDPELAWSTYLGSATWNSVGDFGYSVATGEDGSVTLVGRTDWYDFPTTPGAYQHPSGSINEIFVTRMRGSDGALVYSCVIGGVSDERAFDVAVDDLGRATVSGRVGSFDFPVTPGAYDTQKSAINTCTFLLRLSPQGDALEYSTFFESEIPGHTIEALALDVDPTSGAAVIGGFVVGRLPVTASAFSQSPSSVQDGFVTRFDPTGSALEWSTYFGGSRDEEIWDLEIDGSSRVTVAGYTLSLDLPVTPGAFQTQFGYPEHLYLRTGFVARLDAQGSNLEWSTYLGGSGPIPEYGDQAHALSLDPSGNVIVVGNTNTDNFPTTPGAYQQTLLGDGDCFVARLTSDGRSLLGSTLFCSPETEIVTSVGCDGSGLPTIAGYSFGSTPTTPGAFMTAHTGSRDGFVARLNPSGSQLLYSSFIGGTGVSDFSDVSLGSAGRATLVGTTTPGYPTTPGAVSPNYNGGQFDVCVTSLDLLLEGVAVFGEATPSCRGHMQLNTTRMPSAGAADFGLYCSSAPPLSSGWLLVGKPRSEPTYKLGTSVWIDLDQPFERIPIQTDADGYVEVPFPLTTASPGATVSFQCFVKNTPSCSAAGPWSASNALTITAQ